MPPMPRKKVETESLEQANGSPGVAKKRRVRARAKKNKSVVHKDNNFIQHFMDTAQQPGIVRGVLILGGVLITLSCAGILYVYFSEKTYTTVSPAAQNKMIAASLRVETGLSPQQNSNVVDSLKVPAPPKTKSQTAGTASPPAIANPVENINIINSLK